MIELNKTIDGTVFFIDMRNFTFLCSKMADNPAEDKIVEGHSTQYETRLDLMIEVMGGFYNEWSNLLRKYIDKGEIENAIFQSTGDGIMVAVDGPRHFITALTASTEIAKGIEKRLSIEINPKLSKLGIHRWDDLLGFGIGICSGTFRYVEVPRMVRGHEVTLDDSGLDSHDITILGTAPNFAARVQHATKDHCRTHIIIAEPTVELLCKNKKIEMNDVRKIEDTFGIKYLWKHPFKGIKELGLYMYVGDSTC